MSCVLGFCVRPFISCPISSSAVSLVELLITFSSDGAGIQVSAKLHGDRGRRRNLRRAGNKAGQDLANPNHSQTR
jgi:hypothetical protein